jgi:hypothetical protein
MRTKQNDLDCLTLMMVQCSFLTFSILPPPSHRPHNAQILFINKIEILQGSMDNGYTLFDLWDGHVNTIYRYG